MCTLFSAIVIICIIIFVIQFIFFIESVVYEIRLHGDGAGILKTDLWPVQTDLEIFRPIYFASNVILSVR